jgi:hypothetical protein
MAALDAAIQEQKAGHNNVTMDGRAKPGHDNEMLPNTARFSLKYRTARKK